MNEPLKMRGFDNHRPKHLVFLKQDLNTKKIRQDRMEEIEHDNRLLLDKMARIMTAKREDTLAEFTPGFRITKNHIPILDNYTSLQSTYPGKAVPKNSLNFSLRRDRMERIIADNLVLLNRINDQKPHYKTKQYLKKYRDKDAKYRKLYSRNATAGHLRSNSLPSLNDTRANSAPEGASRDGGATETTITSVVVTSADGVEYTVTVEATPTMDQTGRLIAPSVTVKAITPGKAPVALNITAQQVPFFIPLKRRAQYLQNPDSLVTDLAAKVDVVVSEGAAMPTIAPCEGEERVSFGLGPTIQYRKKLVVPMVLPDSEEEDERPMIIEATFHHGTMSLSGYTLDNGETFVCPQRIKYKQQIIDQGREDEVIAQLFPKLCLKSTRGQYVMVLRNVSV